MHALPLHTTYDDKFYAGFWAEDQRAAVMDLITHDPEQDTVFIGLFMLSPSIQGVGRGSLIIEECGSYFKKEGYASIRLGYAQGNPQGEHFWKKNGFEETGLRDQNDDYTAVLLKKAL